MTLEEFAKLTGFKPDQEYYHSYIEPKYLESDLDKSDWCKQWVKKGGIQKAYNDLNDVCDVHKRSYEAYFRMYRSIRDDYEKLLKERNELLKEKNGFIEERNDALKKIENSKNILDAVIEKLNDLYKQRQNEKDDLSVLITKLLEVKLLNHELR